MRLLLILSTCLLHVSAFVFAPDTVPASDITVAGLAPVFNAFQSQTVGGIGNSSITTSWYSISYITASNGHQYCVFSHIQGAGDVQTYFRASILDITEPTLYQSFVLLANNTLPYSTFNFTTSGGGMEALSPDQLSTIHTWSVYAGVVFNITFEASAKLLYNNGAGYFPWGTAPASEWGMPQGKTSGTLTIDGEEVDIDPERSMTWYDRQWADGYPSTGNWTWFALHLDGSDMKISYWAVDNASPYLHTRFATIRYGDGTHEVLPMNLTESTTAKWTSSATNVTYPLAWAIKSSKGDILRITSFRDDQEMAGPVLPLSAYEGFVACEGVWSGKPVRGFGAVEMVRFIL